ncbi:SpoIIE family protein phosphatase [Clostridium sp. DL1XJH146]
MSYFIDFAYESLNKFGEELCGDHIEVNRTKDGMIIVLADGLGSGVKANILATLTSKIAGTMLKEGASIQETVDTIAHTLPICSVRKVAYSTFTIIEIFNSGKVNAIEYDNPPFLFFRNNKLIEVPKEMMVLDNKKIYKSTFYMKDGDYITVVSDGAIHAGVGKLLNLGWQWENIAEFLGKLDSNTKTAFGISKDLLQTCNDLYANKPGDDTTVMTIKLTEPEYVEMIAGPPKNPDDDEFIFKKFMRCKGSKIICGGTTANIAARVLDKRLEVNEDTLGMNVPPTAYIEGFDLVTEGVLTLTSTVEIIKGYLVNCYEEPYKYKFDSIDGATRLAEILLNRCTHLHLWVGKAVNPAHQNPDFPLDLNIKLKIINELSEILKQLGKNVEITYLD